MSDDELRAFLILYFCPGHHEICVKDIEVTSDDDLTRVFAMAAHHLMVEDVK